MTRGVTPRRRAVAATDSPRATSRTARARRNRRASWAARSCRWSRRRCQAVRVKVSITASLYGKGTRNALSAKRLLRTCLALNNYENTNGFFPPGRTTGNLVLPQVGLTQHSWSAFALPYLEQGNVYALYRVDKNWDDPANYAAVRVPMAVFNCPSTPNSPRFDTTISSQPACGDYSTINALKDFVAINCFGYTRF